MITQVLHWMPSSAWFWISDLLRDFDFVIGDIVQYSTRSVQYTVQGCKVRQRKKEKKNSLLLASFCPRAAPVAFSRQGFISPKIDWVSPIDVTGIPIAVSHFRQNLLPSKANWYLGVHPKIRSWKSPHPIELDVRKPLVVLYLFHKDVTSRDSTVKFRIWQFPTPTLKHYLQMYTFELTFEITLC